MSSSISGSDFAVSESAAWRRFAVRVVLTAAGLSAAVLALFVAADPYDTGRFALIHAQGTTESGGRIGDASRIHDEAFDAAIFGNSHVMTLKTERLSAQTGLHFAMLAVEGTSVPDQMTMLDAYLRRHSPPKALVIGIDWGSCYDDLRGRPEIPFPTWLYAANPWAYINGLFGLHTFEVLGRRLLYLLGAWPPQGRDGTVDIFRGVPHTPAEAARLIQATSLPDVSGQTVLPAFRGLADRLDRLHGTAVVLLLPPVAAPALPRTGTAAAAALDACKARALDLASTRPNVRVVDWLKTTPEGEDTANFWDATHYYDGLARRVEADVVAALAGIAKAP